MELFIAFEGLDGSGKTTQVGLLAESLRRHEFQVLTTREPGGTPAGESIRQIMFGPRSVALHPLTWAFLMTAARSQLVTDVISPALTSDVIVIADRYWYSTLAYQGAADGVDQDFICHISEVATAGLEPDMVIYLEVSPETAMGRTLGGPRDVLDSRPFDFHHRVAQSYQQLARSLDHWELFDGGLPVDSLADMIERHVLHKLEEHVVLAGK